MGPQRRARATEVSLPSVIERDVDHLLLEEVAANPKFARWLVSRCIGLSIRGKPVLSVSRGVTTENGESDLEISLRLRGDSVHRLLIENKVGAGLQPRQAQRYRERGAAYVSAGDCSGFTTVLVAPRDYLGDRGPRGFDKVIPYEEIRDWFAKRASESIRMAVKEALLTCAIQKSHLGYVPVASDPVTDFWRGYWALCSELAPELEMPEPGPKPARASFIVFRPEGLPREVRLLHKVRRGSVDLEFAGAGRQLARLRKRLGPHLKSNMVLCGATKSGAVRIKVPVLSTIEPFSAQEDAARSGIAAAKRLLNWASEVLPATE